ncbi:MAG: helix-turn-helix domain-containing protein [Acidimicrobiales bacterium]|nr:helix-turn-helix domain-containing protein [Acidimicrobiales bacterium]
MVQQPAHVAMLEEQRRTARERILRAARVVLAERGLSVRVEDVADAAGISRRTVFRHFESRDALLAAALRDSMRSYGDRIPRYEAGRPLADWLHDAFVAAHEMNARHGRVYFELALATELEGPLAEVAALRRVARGEFVRRFSDAAWRASGASGHPPGWLVDTAAILLSAFATEALVGDFGRTPAEAGEVAARALQHSIAGAAAR